MECSRPSRHAPPNRNRCGFHKYLGMVCGGSIQIIRHESAGYGGIFCSNRGSVRHNCTNFSVRIGQASFTKSNRIGQTGLFPNGPKSSGPQKDAEGQNGQNAERRRKGYFSAFRPASTDQLNWWLTRGVRAASACTHLLTICEPVKISLCSPVRSFFPRRSALNVRSLYICAVNRYNAPILPF